MGQQNSKSRSASVDSLKEAGLLDKDLVGTRLLLHVYKRFYQVLTFEITSTLVDLHAFSLQETIGKGAFGKVKKVKLKQTKQLFALKYMEKKGAIEASCVKNIFEERRLLETIEHPYIVNLRFAFQDYYNMFFVLDLALGGDLRWQINTAIDFPMQTIQLYAAQLTLALEYLHEQKIIHRDIKPDNLLLDEKGHIHICDFNVSYRVEDRLPKRRSGTLCYMAPEMLSGERYDYVVDFWMMGVTLYEIVYKRRPFIAKASDDELISLINAGKLSFPDFKLYHEKKLKHPKDVYQPTADFKSFIESLLQVERKKRLGYKHNPIKGHAFVSGLDFEAVLQQEVTPLYAPDATQANFNVEHQINEFIGNEKQLSHTKKIKKKSGSVSSISSLAQDKPFNLADLPKGAEEQLEFIELYFKPYRSDTKAGMLTERPNYIDDTLEKSPANSVMLGSPASIRKVMPSKEKTPMVSSPLARSATFGSRPVTANNKALTKSMSGLAQ